MAQESRYVRASYTIEGGADFFLIWRLQHPRQGDENIWDTSFADPFRSQSGQVTARGPLLYIYDR